MQKKIENYFLMHKDEILADIASLVAINSVRGEAKEGMPFGEGPAKALAEAEKIISRMGFTSTNFDNYALTVNCGEGDAYLGILSHLDVVAEGTGWTKEPFKMEIDGNKIYGRGVTDDKGPAVVALWALKACKDLGININKKVRLIFGADEECGSSDLKYYFQKENPPKYCLSPDADFPIYNCEKGSFNAPFRAKYENKALPALISFKGGHTTNIVAQHSEALVEGLELAEAQRLAKEVSESTKTEITVSEEGKYIKFSCEGTSAHASTPEKGNNTVTALVSLLDKAPLAEGDLKNYIHGLAALFPHGDYYGKAIGVANEDEVSGKLTLSFNILDIADGEIMARFDSRCPVCSNEENMSLVVDKKLKEYGFKLDTTEMNPPHYVSEDLPFIKTLSKAYEDFTGMEGKCCSMGGGTYVHHIENGVAFGPCFPGTVTNIHGADEVGFVDQLLKCGMIYAAVIAEMCK